jgi:cytochrome P450
MTRPTLATDLYTDAAIVDPYPIYRTIRDLGPAVWLSAHDAWAIGRFDDVRAALRADETLVSGHGVALNDQMNVPDSRITLTSDGDVHRQLRGVLMKPMMPSALRAVQGEIEALADALVMDLIERDAFDGIADFARHLPVAVVSHLVGLPEDGRQRMLEWAKATFDALGPMNARGQAAIPLLMEMLGYAMSVDRATLKPSGWAALLFAAADEGKIAPTDVASMLIDYIAPSLDTTILGLGHLLFQLGRHPEQWAMLRADPALVPRAIDEALRLEAPVRAFTRWAVADYDVGGPELAAETSTTIPAGSRVLVLFASGNRDERRFPDPDRFDVTRDARDHLGFGHGVHRCAGSHVAQLEMQSLLRAMVVRVHTIEVGPPEIGLNNVLYGYRAFRATFR